METTESEETVGTFELSFYKKNYSSPVLLTLTSHVYSAFKGDPPKIAFSIRNLLKVPAGQHVTWTSKGL